jgi:topoisomerase-4 subunit A
MTTKETVIKAVDDGFNHIQKTLKTCVTEEDILRLLDIRIMRISKLTVKPQDKIEALEGI